MKKKNKQKKTTTIYIPNKFPNKFLFLQFHYNQIVCMYVH